MKSFVLPVLAFCRVYIDLMISMKHKVNLEHHVFLSGLFIEICHVFSDPNPKGN